jgi:Sulfotransferase family
MSGTGKTLKSRLWQAAQPLAIAAGRWNAGSRVLPDFLVVGAQRAGTTSLHEWLARHPAVRFPRLGKGVHYFDTASQHSPSWYRAHFPRRAAIESCRAEFGPTAVGEASPYYLFHPAVPGRVRALLPDVRYIAILRDPVSRAWSHYLHEVRRGHETRDFVTALMEEPAALHKVAPEDLEQRGFVSYEHQHHSYLARGRYSEQLERWFALVGRERGLVLVNHELFAPDGSGAGAVLDLLGLEPRELGPFPRENATTGGAMPDEARAHLEEHFAEEADRVSELLGRSVRWKA